MNTVNLMGRLTADPETKQASTPVTTYTLAVNRGKDETDFINCVAFGRSAEFAAKYFAKGMQVAVTGSIRTGSYVNKEGRKVYTTDIVVDRQYFADSKKSTPEDWQNVDFENTPFA